MPPNPVVAFGSSEDSYYIGCGLRYYDPGMPDSLANTLNTMAPIQIPWLAIDGEAQVWIARDAYHEQFHFHTGIPNKVLETLKGKAEYVTFGATKEYYFVKLGPGQWTAKLQDGAIEGYEEIRKLVGENFDAALTAIIFGKGNFMVYGFRGGFTYYLDDEAQGSNVQKLLDEYTKDNEWLLEQGSSLCQWNIDYFYLIFKHKSSGKVEMRWRLPESMNAKLQELCEYADTPEGNQAIQNRRQYGSVLANQRHENELMLTKLCVESDMMYANTMLQLSLAGSEAMRSVFSHRR